jgi:hypothetical protein
MKTLTDFARILEHFDLARGTLRRNGDTAGLELLDRRYAAIVADVASLDEWVGTVVRRELAALSR